MDTEHDDILDEVLDVLSTKNIPTRAESQIVKTEEPETQMALPEFTEERPDAEDVELEGMSDELDVLIKANADILDEAKRLVETTGDVEYFNSFSSVSKAQTDAIRTKVKLLLDKQKNRKSYSLKDREVKVKEVLADQRPSDRPQSMTQTNIIMSGSREEMFNHIKRITATDKPIDSESK